ncbi:hypothetical protein IJ798_03045 [Candidatus Saccharibacteria bacterium]|nr:hypothetical protein [Candidatus Saccharibacteria bacterium]
MLLLAFFFLLTFFPMISVGSFSIPTILIFSPILFFKKTKFNFNLLKVSFIASLVLCLIHTPVLFATNNLTLKGFSYILYPLFIFLIFTLISNIFNRVKKEKLFKYLKIFLLIQLVFCVLQITNIFNINEILNNVYLFWQSTNALKTTGLLEVSYRPFGTIGSPIYLAIISFAFGEILRLNNSNKVWYLISIALILLSGAKIVIIALAILLFYRYILKILLKHPIKSLAASLVFILIAYLSVKYIPFMQILYNRFFIEGNSVLDDYSLSYRLSMLELFKDNMNFLFFGGYGIENFPPYVDSEIILRGMQLGIVGFSTTLTPYLSMKQVIEKRSLEMKPSIRQYLFVLALCSMTSVVFTNLYLIPYILLLPSTLLMKRSKK